MCPFGWNAFEDATVDRDLRVINGKVQLTAIGVGSVYNTTIFTGV